MNKDVLLWIVGGFIIAIAFIVSYYTYSVLNTEFFQAVDYNADAKTFFNDLDTRLPSTWDYAFLFIMIGVSASIIFLSYMLRTEPIFFVALWFIVFIGSIISGYLANTFYEVTENTIFSVAAGSFPIMVFIMNHYLVYTLIMSFLMLFVFFAKPRDEAMY